MRRVSIMIAVMVCVMSVAAQDVLEGLSYYLPKTALRFVFLVEKTSYTPGDFAIYSERYLKENAENEAATAFRIIDIKMETFGVPDKDKTFVAHADRNLSITSIDKDDSGILIGVNATGNKAKEHVPFTPAVKEKPLSPRDYLTQDILAAGSMAKMAELTALEIYDIRESRNLLNRGQADFMPQDGEQLRIMLSNLDTQEKALMQLFAGRTVKDTAEVVVEYVPQGEVERDVLMRFSGKLGTMDKEDLGGEPYYVSVEDYGVTPQSVVGDETKKERAMSGVHVNLPGKIKVTLIHGATTIKNYDLYAAQFGRTEELGASLFSKKMTTSLVLSPVTGNALHLETVPLK